MFELTLALAQVMKWFWTVVSSFTQEELARLLQFTTGSSQLPPGGFNTLCPSFQIIAAPTHSTLPTAHTWSVGKHRLTYIHASRRRVSDISGRGFNISRGNINLMDELKCFTETFMVPMLVCYWFSVRASFLLKGHHFSKFKVKLGPCAVSFLTTLGRSVCSGRF